MRRFTVCAVALFVVAGLSAAPPQKPREKKESVPDDLVKKITEAMPKKAPAAPARPRKVLVFNQTRGFRHGSIPIASKTLEIMGQKTGAFQTVATEDLSYFEADKLKEFDAVVMNNTTGPIFGPAPRKGQKANAEQEKGARFQRNLLEFVKGGKGLIGIHAATDWQGWEEYGEMIGGQFASHPYRKIVCKNEDPDNPINAAFAGKEFPISDEIYVFRENFTRKNLRILLSLNVDKSDVKNQARQDRDYWVSWVRPYGQGRVFYCSLGHDTPIFYHKQVLQHYLAGIQYALGDLKANDQPRGELKEAAR